MKGMKKHNGRFVHETKNEERNTEAYHGVFSGSLHGLGAGSAGERDGLRRGGELYYR